MNASSTSTNRALAFFRWVALIPSALAGALIVRAVIFYINRFTLSATVPSFLANYVGPDSFLGGGCVVMFSDGALGASLVFIASMVAPTYKRPVVFLIGALAVILGLGRSLYLVATQDYWGAFTYFCVAAGSLGCAAYLVQSRYGTFGPRPYHRGA